MLKKRLIVIIVAFLGAASGCYRTRIVTQTHTEQRIAAVVVPYVAVIPYYFAPQDSMFDGQTNCDMAGQPYILVRATLAPPDATFVALHERVHVEQIRLSGLGCRGFMHRYQTDTPFKLAVEAEAYCAVYEAQRQLGEPVDPDLDQIVGMLTTIYNGGKWTADEVKKALRCWPP